MHRDLEDTSDDSLIGAVAAGRAEALTTLFGRRQREVYRFALHMTGVPAVAEDVTQDVFLIVLRDAGRYDPSRSSVAAWLCGIARNCARQRLERDRRLQGLDDTPGIDDRAAAETSDPVDDLSRTARVDRLRRAVLALPVRYREVLVLCDLQELSYAEAAEALDCAIGTVRSRLHRARAALASRVIALEQPRAGAPAGPAPADDGVSSSTGTAESAGFGVAPKRCMA
jgi:RNA polymerase sigma-70 factor (ECF subfamily)